ncbi:SMC family ATPase [Actinomycetaceae bacterium TAE3-ERU4]|nr:SMC family ATPase [Actinomycetaceae bacterium TAE3-ERU4]
MRIMKLTFSGIGPFPGTHTIDLENFCESGLFLLEGPTGSGKSTILDAITFALYGDVAGQSDSSKQRLRSAFSKPHDRSFVELLFEIGQQTYLVEREPKYTRPGRSTPVSAKANLKKVLPDGKIQLLATGARQTGEELSTILPLNLGQFLQTVVLPQGKFESFLKAKPTERQELLQRIFGTEIYRIIADIFQEMASESTQKSNSARKILELSGNFLKSFYARPDILSTDSPEALPKIIELTSLDLPLGTHQLRFKTLEELVAQLIAHETNLLQKIESTWEKNNQNLLAARKELEIATRQNSLIDKRNQARVALSELNSDTPKIEKINKKLEEDTRAQRVSLAHATWKAANDNAEQLKIEKENAEEKWDTFVLSSTSLYPSFINLNQTVETSNFLDFNEDFPSLLPSQAKLIIEEKHEHLIKLRQLCQLTEERKTQKAELEEKLEQTTTSYKELEESYRILPKEIEDLNKKFSEKQKLSLEIPGNKEKYVVAKNEVDIHLSLIEIEKKHKLLTQELEAFRSNAENAAQKYRETLNIWINSSASRLAQELKPGQACSVCGSLSHPNPASPVLSEEITLSYIESLEAERNNADKKHQRAAHALIQLSERQENQHALLNTASLEEAKEKCKEVKNLLEAALQAEKDLSALEATLRLKKEEAEELKLSLPAAKATIVALSDSVKKLHDEIVCNENNLKINLGRYSSLEEAQNIVSQLQALNTPRINVEYALENAQRTAQKTLENFLNEVEKNNFSSPDEYQISLLDSTERKELQETVQNHNTQLQVVQSLLNEPDIKDLPQDASIIDCQKLQEKVTALQTVEEESRELKGIQKLRLKDVKNKLQEVKKQYLEVINIDSKNLELLRLTNIITGKKSDNLKQTPLINYVLLARLDQILQVANPLLLAMSAGRYEIERTAREENQGTRTEGLGIAIIDHTCESRREAKTLSGGESFCASLSLALALANVVCSENGGISIETMFIDEGFGTLSPEYLEAVTHQLIQLSNTGRQIGIISHVPELKERIREQIRIRPLPDGSSTINVIS